MPRGHRPRQRPEPFVLPSPAVRTRVDGSSPEGKDAIVIARDKENIPPSRYPLRPVAGPGVSGSRSPPPEDGGAPDDAGGAPRAGTEEEEAGGRRPPRRRRNPNGKRCYSDLSSASTYNETPRRVPGRASPTTGRQHYPGPVPSWPSTLPRAYDVRAPGLPKGEAGGRRETSGCARRNTRGSEGGGSRSGLEIERRDEAEEADGGDEERGKELAREVVRAGGAVGGGVPESAKGGDGDERRPLRLRLRFLPPATGCRRPGDASERPPRSRLCRPLERFGFGVWFFDMCVWTLGSFSVCAQRPCRADRGCLRPILVCV